MNSELSAAEIEAAKKFKEVLCEQCPNKIDQSQKVLFAEASLVRSIKEIEQMLRRDNISPDVRATLEWVTYARETI